MLLLQFLRLLAARSGQILTMTGIATAPGLALHTVKAWIIVPQPYHANLGKRLVKRPSGGGRAH